MSKEELLTAYAEGAISRRNFVRRLVATGVSAGAAVSYAQLLAPPAEAGARRGGGTLPPGISEHYPLLTLKITTRDLADVVRRKRLKVKMTVSESSAIEAAAFVKRKGDLAYLGSAPIEQLAKGDSLETTVPIKVDDLTGQKSVEVYVNATVSRTDDPYHATQASTKATIKK
jgi:hypothetical protein